jgi:hypothetical protein
VASARLSPQPTASDVIGSRYERLGNDLIALGTLEGPRLDIPGRTNPRQHHTRLAARTPRALDNARRNDRGVSLLHGTPPLLGGSIPELTVTVRCPDGPAITECTKLPSICPLPDSTQKLRSAWNDRGQRRFFGRKFSSRDFHREDPLGAPRLAVFLPSGFVRHRTDDGSAAIYIIDRIAL